MQVAYRAEKDIEALSSNLSASEFSIDENADVGQSHRPLFSQIEKIGYFRTTRKIKKGDLLFIHDLSPINLIETGKIIKVLGEANGIQVQSEGRALGAGSIGQTITIENQKSKRKYSAEVIDYNTVKLQL